jgi:hypothetical protein
MALVPTVSTVKSGDWNSVLMFNYDTQRAFQKLGSLILGPGSVPAFGSMTLVDLTASRLVYTDSTKTLASASIGTSLSFSTGTLNTIQGIRTTDTPTFGGLTLTGLAGVLKAAAGVISGSAIHSDLGSIGANDHHNQAHVLNGADHTVSGLTTGHVLQALSATTFGFAVTPGTHDPVTIPVSANGLSLTGQEISLPTSATPQFAGLTINGNLAVDTSTLFVNATSDFVGIGTATPAVLLELNHPTINGFQMMTSYYGNSSSRTTALVGRLAGGVPSALTATPTGQNMLVMGGRAYTGTQWETLNRSTINFVTEEEHTDAAQGAYIAFSTTPTGSITRAESLRITGAGRLGLGTTAPDKALEINSADGTCLRLTYNDSNGTASNYVDYAVTSSGDGTITPSGGDLSVAGNLYPATDNTYYLGKNDDDTPFAWKGLVLKDQAGTGKYYRIEVYGDALRIVDLTD